MFQLSCDTGHIILPLGVCVDPGGCILHSVVASQGCGSTLCELEGTCRSLMVATFSVALLLCVPDVTCQWPGFHGCLLASSSSHVLCGDDSLHSIWTITQAPYCAHLCLLVVRCWWPRCVLHSYHGCLPPTGDSPLPCGHITTLCVLDGFGCLPITFGGLVSSALARHSWWPNSVEPCLHVCLLANYGDLALHGPISWYVGGA